MKNMKLFILSFALVLFSNISWAQNKSQFKISSSGEASDQNGVKLGWIESDGTIKNAKGEVVGKVEKNDKESVLHDKLGKKIGAVSADGTLKGNDGKVLYTISTADENGICKIIDAAGKEVGTVHANYKQQGACAHHCLVQTKK